MTKGEMHLLKAFDQQPIRELSLNDRAMYITLLKKLRSEVQLSLSFLEPDAVLASKRGSR